jgi:hypothetical protein
MRPCIGLKNHIFIFYLYRLLSMFIYKLSDRRIILTKIVLLL